jgi:hypothetical protein
MLYLVIFIAVAALLAFIDMKDLKINGKAKNITVYISLMAVSAGLYGWYCLADNVSIFGAILRRLNLI